MKAIGEVMKTLMKGMTLDSKEIESYICDGCGQQTTVIEMPILGGSNKGKIERMTKGCICWEIEQGRQALVAQQKIKLKNMFDSYSLINPDLAQATFDTYEPTNETLKQAKTLAVNYVTGFSLDKPSNLLFGGSYGLGKSHLSQAICKGLGGKGYTTIFISIPKLLTKIRSTYNRESQVSEGELIEALGKVDCLVLDDVGAERVKKEEEGESWAVEKLFEIVDSRNGKHTIYTTNLNSNELSRKVGPRNFSRMMMNTKSFKFEGEDYRIKNKRF